ncbi:64e31f00-1dad-4146-baad-b689f1b5a19c [Thermothielavioides terrestris]
MFIKG